MPPHERLACDVNLTEEAELRAAEDGQRPIGPDTSGWPRVPGGEGMGPARPAAPADAAPTAAPPSAATPGSRQCDEDGAAEGGGEEEDDDDEGEEGAGLRMECESAPTPPVYPDAKREQLGIQAQNIKLNLETRAGIKTYKSSWTDYRRYHNKRYHCDPPSCPMTGLIWLNCEQATDYMSYMARAEKTSSQV